MERSQRSILRLAGYQKEDRIHVDRVWAYCDAVYATLMVLVLKAVDTSGRAMSDSNAMLTSCCSTSSGF